MDVVVIISKEKKEKDFRMVVIPSGRSERGFLRTKDYGIIAYPDKKDLEKFFIRLQKKLCIIWFSVK